ncbi:MAG TPA: NnrS family protein [Bryobacteraceae bacterium]
MTSAVLTANPAAEESSARERALQRLVTAFIATGLVFLLLPGTFLGVWNLIAISHQRAVHSFSSAWIQAHGQAQLFGWIGTFVIGIGFYSLSKMGRLKPFVVSRGWQSWALWTAGIALHWLAGVYEWQWRMLLPLSAFLMLSGFLFFFSTVRQHQPKQSPIPVVQPKQMWMRLVMCSTFAFLACLLLNAAGAVYVASRGLSPALPSALDTRLILLSAWGFLVLTVWGFNARWLPVFAGLRQPSERGLKTALAILIAALAVGLAGGSIACAALLIVAAAVSTWSLHIFEKSVQPAKMQNIHRSFPYFIRAAYVWLLIAAALAFAAALFDRNGGVTGASRHALTVGFLATMVFAIGCRVLPAFCGMKILFSPRLMFYALTLLNIGCFLRIVCEIPAYELNQVLAWLVLPVSAIAELAAVALFASNLLATFARAPAYLQTRKA